MLSGITRTVRPSDNGGAGADLRTHTRARLRSRSSRVLASLCERFLPENENFVVNYTFAIPLSHAPDMMSIQIDDPPFRAGGRPRSIIREDVMKLRLCGPLTTAAFAAVCVFGSAQSLAQNAYITNFGSNTPTLSR
jgi:hypothetical protein